MKILEYKTNIEEKGAFNVPETYFCFIKIRGFPLKF